MTAVRAQIFGVVDARLSSLAQEYERMPSGAPSKFPCLYVFDNGDRSAEDGEESGTTRKVLQIGIDGYVSGSGGAAAHDEANALYASVIEALFPEPVFGGLASEIEEVKLDMDVAMRASTRRIAFSLDIEVHYATRRGSPQVID